MRVVISKIQEHLSSGTIFEVKHVSSKNQLGDVLTKRGASPDKLLVVLETGKLIQTEEEQENGRNESLS